MALCAGKDVSQGEHQQPRESMKGMEGSPCARQAWLRERAKVLLLSRGQEESFCALCTVLGGGEVGGPSYWEQLGVSSLEQGAEQDLCVGCWGQGGPSLCVLLGAARAGR